MLVELIRGNYAIYNCLVNGAEGIFKFYTNQQFDIVWINFQDSAIGQVQRSRMQQVYMHVVMYNWMFIKRIYVHKPIKKKKIMVWLNLPIQLACARTIHRAQCLTMDRLAFDPTRIK